MARNAHNSAAASSGSEKWYYMDGGKKIGPVEVSQLVSKLTSGELPPDTSVWVSGMDKWSPASETDLVNWANSQQAAWGEGMDQKEKPSRKSRWWIWLIIGLLVAAIVGVACAFLFSRKKAPEVPVETAATEPAVITYGLDNPTVFENEQCAFLIDSIGEQGDYLELDVQCINKTSDVLMFSWRNTSVNGNMFNPLWSVRVASNSTTKSSITFPLSTLNSLNLLSADEIKFVLSVFNESHYRALLEESAKYIIPDFTKVGDPIPSAYQKIKGYDKYLFTWKVKKDENGRPYYLKNKKPVYFDEIRDANGELVYTMDFIGDNDNLFYRDLLGRPYYFEQCGYTICHSCESTAYHDCGTTMCLQCGSVIYHECGGAVYYDGYGFAFHDNETGKSYFYDINGKPAYYGNDGIPEYYEGTPTQEMLDAEVPEDLERANGSFLVHEEFTIYPTGRNADEITYPDRIQSSTEQVYWNGEKGSFVVLGGQQNVTGYIVHTYIENRADHYMYLCWEDVQVNGMSVFPDTSEALRPHSRTYKSILIPAKTLSDLDIDAVEEIAFRVHAAGENLSIPLYPIVWDAVEIDVIPEE